MDINTQIYAAWVPWEAPHLLLFEHRGGLGMGNPLQLQAVPEERLCWELSAADIFSDWEKECLNPKVGRTVDSTSQHPLQSTPSIAWIHFFFFFLFLDKKCSGRSSSQIVVYLFPRCNTRPAGLMNYSPYHCHQYWLFSIIYSRIIRRDDVVLADLAG